ncbi:MAG TPA: sugar kinase [Aestuariivirgaceae bacterium]|nr:sugar kinase [Aestuariivirgaceae bacterium]
MSVACIGECMVEFVASRRHPGLFERAFAGDTLNTCLYLARLLKPAGHRICYVTRLGDDPLSAAMTAAWEAEGIDCSLVARIAGRVPGLYLVDVRPDGERSFTYWRGQSPVRDLFREPEPALERELGAFQLLFVTGVTLAVLSPAGRRRLLDVLLAARSRGAAIAYDTNHRPRLWEDAATARDWNLEAMAAATILLPSREDLDVIFDERRTAAAWLGELAPSYAREVVVKDAGAPAHGRDGDEIVAVAPAAVEPVDTTAGGDSFNAAYLAARLAGNDIRKSIEKAHALAGIVIRHPGAIIPAAAMTELGRS